MSVTRKLQNSSLWSQLKYFSLTIILFFTITTSAQQRCFRQTVPRGASSRCSASDRYRTINGRCNNLAHPAWGSAGSTLLRLLPNAYSDGVGAPRGGRTPSSLPNPRWISQKNHPDNDVPDDRFTHMVMQFGQFLDHDLTLTPKDESTDCCSDGATTPDCFTIAVPSPDRFFSWVNNTVRCLNMVRSTPVCRLNTREQYNELTSFVDASNVYGSETEQAAVLRTYTDGRLQRNSNTDQLPTREQLNVRPNTRLLRPQKSEDFMAGDTRVNEHPFLATMHVMFMREHNRIAKLLKEYLPQHLATDEILYQEARRLVGAEMQNIVYGEYLPTVLGVDFMTKYDLIVEEETKYDPKVDATILNSFASAAFRFGHSMINGMFKLVSQRRSAPSRSSSSSSSKPAERDVYWLWRLREVFDGQSVRGARLPLENMLEGLITQQPQTCDAFFTTEITDHLFQKNNLRQNFGEDLLALNLQRGREHGIPDYNSFRRKCGLRPIRNWSKKPAEFEDDIWKKLESAYESVDDIDLYIGGVAEKNVRGGVVGPTFACILGEQFSRLKKGDRFFYTHTAANGARGLGPVAKDEVLQRTLGDVMCDVSQLDQVQKWVTLQPNSDYNSYETCLSKRRLNMRAIANEIAQELGSGGQQQESEQVRRRLVNGGPTNRNNLLQNARPIQINNAQDSRTIIGTVGNNAGSARVPADFAFPPEVARSSGVGRRAQARQQQLQQQQQRIIEKASNLFKRPDLTAKASARKRDSLINRLAGAQLGRPASPACLFNLC